MNENLFETGAQAGAETTNEWLTAHCDGGSRGNPGPSGYGAVIEDAKGQVLVELSEFVGMQTNNFAEYSGLLGVLKWTLENGGKRLRVISDSELMVKQMQGKYSVKSPVLKPLYDEAKKLTRQLEGFEMRHTLRGGNKEADRLANEAMDRGMKKTPLPKVGKPEDFVPRRQLGQPAGGAASPQVNKPASPAASSAAANGARQTLEGYVKDGVVHLLGGELPDGIFVKVIRE